MQLGNTDKWYVDQTQSNYEALAVALKAQYPQLRVGIGPASLNDQYFGTNPPKQQVESFIAGFVPPPLHGGNPPDFVRKAPSATAPSPAKTPSPITAPAAVPKRGDKIWVLIPGIGPVDALFVAALPEGEVLIDLDGVETPVEQSAVHTDLLAAEAAAMTLGNAPEAPTAAPETPEAAPEPAVAPETPEASAAAPKAPTAATEPAAAPTAATEPPEAPTAATEPAAAQAESS